MVVHGTSVLVVLDAPVPESILLLGRKQCQWIYSIVTDIEILDTNWLAGQTVDQVQSSINMCPNWMIVWIDTGCISVSFCLAGIIVDRMKNLVAV